MTLAEMADFVCTKVRQTDSAAIAACKSFLAKRYELIYEESLWRDSLWQFKFTFTPDASAVPESWDSTYLCPNVVDRIVALRRTDSQLVGVSAETLFRSSLDEFEQSGDPVLFATSSPVVAIIPSVFTPADLWLTVDGTDAGSSISITYIDSDNKRNKTTFAMVSGANSILANARVVERVTKGTTNSAVTLSVNFAEDTIASAVATDEAFLSKLPLHLIPTPTAATTFRALIKKKAIPLVDDADSPELRGIDHPLLAIAQGDMLQRARQYGKAQLQFQEGLALLATMKATHVYQEGQTMQLVPAIGDPSGEAFSYAGKNYW